MIVQELSSLGGDLRSPSALECSCVKLSKTVQTPSFLQVMSKANILFSSSISMKSVQHTFSVALSRSMVPEAKIIVYGLLNGEEVLADSLMFSVKGIRTDVRTTYVFCFSDISLSYKVNGSGYILNLV